MDSSGKLQIDERLLKNWKIVSDPEGEHLVFLGKLREFNEWIKSWYSLVPRCKDFACSHELSSCGIRRACGSCSDLRTMLSGSAFSMCLDVDCIDCYLRFDCMYGLLTESQREKYELSYIETHKEK